ncbi:class I SAM-dependent methyltransferase [Phenylobacterium immobile]|uniref:class I SAM-dependent methyltransferase n=1 Tax=Phenylobacterium immobile TaxID=21 RepID=UPI000A4891B6|nr:methyltransferase [Phenylobacterium immobile]
MIKTKLMLAAGVVSLLCAGPTVAHEPAAYAAVVAEGSRPDADKARDAARKPAEMLAFANVHPGEVVVELLPGGGYFTRLLSKAVSPTGKVFAVVTAQQDTPEKPAGVRAIAAAPGYANVSVLVADFQTMAPPQKADLVWTSQNYHDLHLTRLNLDVAKVNKAVFDALKPGGRYVIVDHAAPAGTAVDAANTVHRIDPAVVRKEVEAAGFIFVAESDVLRNPADDYAKSVFDPALRGHTDQFVLKFRKPG